MDRFQLPDKDPIEAGECEACNEMMYDYQVTKCNVCDARIHQSCQQYCDSCKIRGCMLCLKEDEGLLFCDICQDPQIKAARKAAATGLHSDLKAYLKVRLI